MAQLKFKIRGMMVLLEMHRLSDINVPKMLQPKGFIYKTINAQYTIKREELEVHKKCLISF
jgi:hypothetical protein